MKFTIEFPTCAVCRQAIANTPDTCDTCISKVHETCMGPDHEAPSGDIYRYCLNCEGSWL